jgi:hypothetical protein
LGSPHLPRTFEPRVKVGCPRRPSSNNGVEFVRTRSIRGVKAAPAMQNGLSFLFPHGFCFVRVFCCSAIAYLIANLTRDPALILSYHYLSVIAKPGASHRPHFVLPLSIYLQTNIMSRPTTSDNNPLPSPTTLLPSSLTAPGIRKNGSPYSILPVFQSKTHQENNGTSPKPPFAPEQERRRIATSNVRWNAKPPPLPKPRRKR